MPTTPESDHLVRGFTQLLRRPVTCSATCVVAPPRHGDRLTPGPTFFLLTIPATEERATTRE